MTARTALVLALALPFVTGLARCDDAGQEPVAPRGNSSLTAARAFEEFPLYLAGASAAGYQLEAVRRTDRTSPAPHTEFSFVYGSCDPPPAGGCVPPLTILLWPACYRYETRYSIPPRERVSIRGVPGRLVREFRRLELYPARTTIVINAAGVEGTSALLGIARRLRGVNVASRAGAPLPPRPRHAGRTIRCRASS